MSLASAKRLRSEIKSRKSEQATVRILPLAAILLTVSLVGGAFWYGRTTGERAAFDPSRQPQPESEITLTEGTRDALRRLRVPVEIRFYSLLDDPKVSNELRDFAGRVDRLLSATERESKGKLRVRRFDSPSDNNVEAASFDSIQPFNLERGNACFLGLAVAHDQERESLPRLLPEWEQALEFDLIRAIIRVAETRPAPKDLTGLERADAGASEDLKRTIPNFASVSLEQGKQILRDAALKEFKAAASEMEIQVKEAQQRLGQAQTSNTEAEQQAAIKQIQQVQLDQAEKLKQISGRLQSQIAALEQLKRE